MEQLSYQANSFEGIVPVLDVGDPSASLIESYRGQQEDQTSILNRMKNDSIIEQRNLRTQQKGFEDLMKFSNAAVTKYGEFKRQEKKQEASKIWAEAYNNADSPEEIKLAEEYQKTVDAQTSAETAIDTSLATNLQKKQKNNTLTVQDSADAAKVQQLTGWRGVVAANARSEASMESYKPALESYINRTNAARRERGLPMLKPGAELDRLKQDFNQKWSEQTGMAMANPGYTAKHVYPRLRRESASATDTYTRQFNRQNSAEQSNLNAIALTNGDIEVSDYFNREMSLTTGDGKTLKTREDVFGQLASLKLDVATTTRLGDQTNPTTGKPYSTHPRWNALATDARQRRNTTFNLGRSEQNIASRQGFEGVTDLASLQAEYNEQLASGIPYDIAYGNYSAARERTDRKIDAQAHTNRIERLIEANGYDYKLTAADMGDAPYSVWRQFANHLAPNANAESTVSMIKESDTFKAIGKDMDGIIHSIDPTIQLANEAEGIKGPPNQEVFEMIAMNDITLRAQGLMLSGDMDENEALVTARNNWVEDQKKLQTAGKFYNSNTGFTQDAITPNASAVAKRQAAMNRLNNTTITNLSTGLNDSDYVPKSSGRYSERIHYLGKRFGKTPGEIINLARAQKGLPPLDPTATDLALGQMDAAAKARIASLGDATPIQLGLRAQISSGQRLTGTAGQRIISLGQQLISMGVGGIWQHRNFNYDSGYVGDGGQEIGGHSDTSHHYTGTAIDIGEKANSPRKLEQIFQYFSKNKERFGICELFYDPSGSRGHPAGHTHHVHVATCGDTR